MGRISLSLPEYMDKFIKEKAQEKEISVQDLIKGIILWYMYNNKKEEK